MFALSWLCVVLYCIVQVVVKRGHYGTVPNNNSHDEGKKSQAGSSSSSSVPFPNRGIIGSGKPSQQPGLFKRPWSICHDADNHLLIVGDRANHRVEIFDKKTLQFLAYFGSRGQGHHQFEYVGGVCLQAGTNHLIVADQFNHRVQVYENPSASLHTQSASMQQLLPSQSFKKNEEKKNDEVS